MADSSGAPSSEPSATRGLYFTLTGVLVIALVVMNLLILSANNPSRALGPHYYVATGDSLSFGFQPNGSIFNGFADDLFAQLKQEELLNKQTGKPTVEINLANYACAGETTSTMINGGCPFRNLLKVAYDGAQLDAVVTFLLAHKGNVSPVTFELGANDVFSDFSSASCTVPDTAKGNADLKTMDDNLTRVDTSHPDDATDPNNGILSRLVNALRISPPLPVPAEGQVRLAGDLVMLNYYNPFAAKCPNSVQFIHTLNDHLAQDAARFHIPIVDVYTAFGGDTGMAANICTYTWFCDRGDIHPTTAGYKVIAQAVEATLGYPRSGPLVVTPQAGHEPPVAAYRQPDA